MKRVEPKNAVWESTRSILENAVIDRRNLRFVAVGLLGMVIDFRVPSVIGLRSQLTVSNRKFFVELFPLCAER
jgi:hypothetical protein